MGRLPGMACALRRKSSSLWPRVALAITLIALGAFRLLWRSWTSATFVFVMAICPPITFTVAFFRKFLLYENYVIYSLPGVIVCAAAGLTLLASARRLPGSRPSG